MTKTTHGRWRNTDRSRDECFDVVVAGGGAAGTAASVAAARLGARTLLIERYGFLGGAATNSLVQSYCGFFSSGEQPIPTVGGIGRDVLERLVALGFDTNPVRSKSGNWIVLIDVEATKFVFDQLVAANSISIRLHTRLVDAGRDDRNISTVTLADHAGLYQVRASAFVDASGEASLAAFSGARMRKPAFPAVGVQPASLPMAIGGVPDDVTFDRTAMAALVREFNDANDEKIERSDGGPLMRLPFSGNRWWMVVDVETDGLTGTDLARAEMSARRKAWRFIEVLRHLAGFENAYIAATGPQLGIRESRRPLSRRDMTGLDARNGHRFPDGIARASWPMEIHDAPGRTRYLPIGGDGFFDISLAALESEDLGNLFFAGRVVGSDDEAYGSLRVMATSFATGQAAGVAAALQARDGIRAEGSAVRAELLVQDAIL